MIQITISNFYSAMASSSYHASLLALSEAPLLPTDQMPNYNPRQNQLEKGAKFLKEA